MIQTGTTSTGGPEAKAPIPLDSLALTKAPVDDMVCKSILKGFRSWKPLPGSFVLPVKSRYQQVLAIVFTHRTYRVLIGHQCYSREDTRKSEQ